MLKAILGHQLLHITDGVALMVRSACLRYSLTEIIKEGWDALIDIEAKCDDDAKCVLIVYRLASRQRARERLEVQTIIARVAATVGSDAGYSCPSMKDLFPEAGALEAAVVCRGMTFV